jgi:hypothetical protein
VILRITLLREPYIFLIILLHLALQMIWLCTFVTVCLACELRLCTQTKSDSFIVHDTQILRYIVRGFCFLQFHNNGAQTKHKFRSDIWGGGWEHHCYLQVATTHKESKGENNRHKPPNPQFSIIELSALRKWVGVRSTRSVCQAFQN